MISHEFVQAKSATDPRNFLEQDHGTAFADNIKSVFPVNGNGVTWGYRVKKRRWKQRISINALRRPEVERFACYKYQDAPPAPNEARRLAIVLASIALDHTEAEYQVERWCVTLSEAERADIVGCAWAGGQVQYLSADEVGNLLGITEAERKGLRIRTFGWAGSTKRSRTLARKACHREYQRAKRARQAAERANVAGGVSNDLRVSIADASATLRVRAALQGGARTVAELCQHSGLDHRQVRPALSRLKERGEVVSVTRGVWALTADAGGPKAAAAQPVKDRDGDRDRAVMGSQAHGPAQPATGSQAVRLMRVANGLRAIPPGGRLAPAQVEKGGLAVRFGTQRIADGVRGLQERGTA